MNQKMEHFPSSYVSQSHHCLFPVQVWPSFDPFWPSSETPAWASFPLPFHRFLGGGFKYFFYFHPYLGKWSKLTIFFQMGWNHHHSFSVWLWEALTLALQSLHPPAVAEWLMLILRFQSLKVDSGDDLEKWYERYKQLASMGKGIYLATFTL